jgi:hypothetical protein
MSERNGGRDPWRVMARASGVAGLVGAALLFGAIIPLGSLGEPPLEASTGDAAEFIRNAAEADWVQPLQTMGSIGMIVFLWFLVGVAVLLRRAEGEPPWRSYVALASAVLLPAYYLVNASWASAAHRGTELEPAVAAYAFDVGNIGFANTWLALGSFAAAAGWTMLSARGDPDISWPRWLGWWGVVAGIGMMIARFVWTVESAWIVFYAIFWVWLLTLAVRLVLGRDVRVGVSPTP